MSLSQTKALQGFCAICIVFHHMGQKTCAPWLAPQYIVHGLDVFVPIGFFFVGVFFFCSGYGLYKSYKKKPDYLQGFMGRRVLPLVLAFLTASIIYVAVRLTGGESLAFPRLLFNLTGPVLYNPYAWFVITLSLFYIGFYLAFKYCKKEKVAVLVMCILVLIYILHCDWWMYGEWWYNTAPLFLVGILFARHEDGIVKRIKKSYVLYMILSFLSTLSLSYLSTHTQEILSCFGTNINYDLLRWISLLSQMLACCALVILLFLLGMKIKIGNKALAFMGTITLELYLMQALFIQMFGYSFFIDNIKPVYYIRNVALFVLVTFVLSILSAVLLKLLHKKIIELLVKHKDIVAVFRKDMKKLLIILSALAVVITLIVSITSHKQSFDTEETLKKYKEDNVIYAEVDGKKMAAYVTGQGDHTVVLLSRLGDPCPGITLKPLANELAKKNRVIILDYLGSGFSDATDKARTAENFVYEIHTALSSLGEKGPFIMMPLEISGIYAQLYTYTYPDEVEAVIGWDSNVPKYLGEVVKTRNISPGEYQRGLKREAKLRYLTARFLGLTGYARATWNNYEPLLDFTHTRTEFEVAQELFVDRFLSKNVADEMAHEYENNNAIMDKRYSKDLPVLFILTNMSCVDSQQNGINWEQLHQDLLTNGEIQKITVVNGDSYIIYRKPQIAAETAQKFIDTLN